MKATSQNLFRVLIVSVIVIGQLTSNAEGRFQKNIPQQNPLAELVLQTGHTRLIETVAFSPDGKVLASGSDDRSIKLWEIETGRILKNLTGHSSNIFSVAFSPTGSLLASGSGDKTIKVWDMRTGLEIRSLNNQNDKDPRGVILSVSFSPDGKNVASASGDGTIIIWEVDSGKKLRTLRGHQGLVWSVSYSPDGKMLASGGTDKTIRIWDMQTGTERRTLPGHQSSIYSVAFAPDGKILASGGQDKFVKLWNLTSGTHLKDLSGETTVKKIEFSRNGNLLVSAGPGKTKLWNLQNGETVGTFDGAFSAAISPKNDLLAIPDIRVNSIKIRSLDNLDEAKTLNGYNSTITSLALSPDGTAIFLGGGDKTIKVWKWQGENGIKVLKDTKQSLVQSFAFSPDGRFLASGGNDGMIKIWDPISGEKLNSFDGSPGSITSIMYSPDGKILASVGIEFVGKNWKSAIKLWNPETGTELHGFPGPDNNEVTAAFSRDGKVFAVGINRTIRLFDVQSGKIKKSLEGHTNDVRAVAFSPNGDTLASAAEDRTIKIWDLGTGRELKTLAGHRHWVDSIAFSPDGTELVSGSFDETFRIWKLETGIDYKSLPRNDPTSLRTILRIAPDFLAGSITPGGKYRIRQGENGWIYLDDVKSGDWVIKMTAVEFDDWVVMDPNGRFDASTGVYKLMHYVIELEPIDFEQIKDRYYTPDLLQRIMRGEDLDVTRPVVPFTGDELYPAAEFEPPEDGQKTLTVKLKNRGGGIGRVQVFVNGAEFLADARPAGFDPKAREAALEIDLSGASFIPGEENRIQIITRNEAGWLRSRGQFQLLRDKRKKEDKPPELYAIIGGISEYENKALNLNYAAKDAGDFARAVELGAARLFGKDKVHIRLLTSGAANDNGVLAGPDSKLFAPTKENFRKAFEEFRKAKPTDIFVIYLAGHGTSVNRGGDTGDTYLFLTREAVSTDKRSLLDEKLRRTTTISSEELADWIREVPALKRAMILDTCAAGAVEASLVKKRDLSPDQIKALDRMKDRTGFFVLMGSAADAQSYEATRYGQGLLTYSLLQGMSGARLRAGEYADVRTLFSYAEDTVAEMARGIGGIQQPRIIAPTESRSFDIGQFTPEETSKFTLAKIKPLILRPTLLNKELGFDDQRLEPLLTRQLRNESTAAARGDKEVKLVYVEADEMFDAIKPSGQYEVSGEEIRLTLRLVRNNTLVKTLLVKGTLRDKDDLGRKIVTAIIENAGNQES